jgi:hypothetical protein
MSSVTPKAFASRLERLVRRGALLHLRLTIVRFVSAWNQPFGWHNMPTVALASSTVDARIATFENESPSDRIHLRVPTKGNFVAPIERACEMQLVALSLRVCGGGRQQQWHFEDSLRLTKISHSESFRELAAPSR